MMDGGSAKDHGQLEIQPQEFRSVDLERQLAVDEQFDLCICLEVAEHLACEAAPNFVRNLCSLSNIVLFSAAIPGQGGTNHVNERWPSYWRDLFAEQGYTALDIARGRIWHDVRVEFWYRQNLLLFANAAGLARISQPVALASEPGSLTTPFDIVHPELFQRVQKQHEEHLKQLGQEVEGLRAHTQHEEHLRRQLEQEVEVAAGLNPLVHYAKTGGVAGKQPNPLFDPSEYTRLANITATNPLVHYLGSKLYRGLELDLIHGTRFIGEAKHLIQILWRKESNAEVVKQIDGILQKDASSPTPHNMFARTRSALLRLKAELLLEDYKPVEALSVARCSIALTPDDSRSASLVKRCVQAQRRNINAKPEPIMLVITCEKHLERSTKLYEVLASHNFHVKLVIGEKAKAGGLGLGKAVLRVPAGDGYEDLAFKVRCGLTSVYENEPEGISVFKIDDDVVCEDMAAFSKEVKRVAEDTSIQYAGSPVYYPSRDHHFRKSSDSHTNSHPLGRKFQVPYANGPFYYLSYSALSAYYIYNLRFPSEIFETQISPRSFRALVFEREHAHRSWSAV
jgi:hypothetical protein